jgi:hypothetical protein
MKLIPDPRWHQRISFVKSALRILAGVALIWGYTIDAGVFFIIAEVLGIVEEIV